MKLVSVVTELLKLFTALVSLYAMYISTKKKK